MYKNPKKLMEIRVLRGGQYSCKWDTRNHATLLGSRGKIYLGGTLSCLPSELVKGFEDWLLFFPSKQLNTLAAKWVRVFFEVNTIASIWNLNCASKIKGLLDLLRRIVLGAATTTRHVDGLVDGIYLTSDVHVLRPPWLEDVIIPRGIKTTNKSTIDKTKLSCLSKITTSSSNAI